MDDIPFYKMSGCGNDFIIIDNRRSVVPVGNLPGFAAKVCRRKMSVGADGLILIETSDAVDFKWRFYNADGSAAEMCGNGARCVARFALLNGIAREQMQFETLAGIIKARVTGEQAEVQMTDPVDFIPAVEIDTGRGTVAFSSINTGVPHVVMEVDGLDNVDVVDLGRRIRQHSHFAPAGTNVNFMARDADGVWAVRTYERGVEDETLACGTGVCAAALVLAYQKSLASPIVLKTRSGSMLKVHFKRKLKEFKDIFLEGDARVIYQGRLSRDAWEY